MKKEGFLITCVFFPFSADFLQIGYYVGLKDTFTYSIYSLLIVNNTAKILPENLYDSYVGLNNQQQNYKLVTGKK